MTIKIYSTPNCVYCRIAKQFFAKRGLAYQEVDVAADAAARAEMVRKSGQLGVPVIEAGERVIVGFDRDALEETLGDLLAPSAESVNMD